MTKKKKAARGAITKRFTILVNRKKSDLICSACKKRIIPGFHYGYDREFYNICCIDCARPRFLNSYNVYSKHTKEIRMALKQIKGLTKEQVVGRLEK